jgi:hypothetical protein
MFKCLFLVVVTAAATVAPSPKRSLPVAMFPAVAVAGAWAVP